MIEKFKKVPEFIFICLLCSVGVVLIMTSIALGSRLSTYLLGY